MNFTWTYALAVGSGAALGACCRWILAVMLNHQFPSLPPGTFLVNVLGGLLAGFVLALLGQGWLEDQHLRLFITTGFLGGLTTFSTFTSESLALLHKHDYFWLFIHTSSHVLTALVFAFVGHMMMQYFLQH